MCAQSAGAQFAGAHFAGARFALAQFDGAQFAAPIFSRGPICRGPICLGPICHRTSVGPNLPPNRRGAWFTKNLIMYDGMIVQTSCSCRWPRFDIIFCLKTFANKSKPWDIKNLITYLVWILQQKLPCENLCLMFRALPKGRLFMTQRTNT